MVIRRCWRVLAVALGAAAIGCGESDGRPDSELGSLVVAETESAKPVDVDRAAADPDALAVALAVPHRRVSALLGPHEFRGSSKLVVTEGGKTVDELSDHTSIDIDADGGVKAVLLNSRDYGREAIFSRGTMYLRPRFGKYHKRPPVDPDEPGRIRDDIYGTLGAYFEPLARRAELTDAGKTTVRGRPARLIKIKTAPEPRKAPAQPHTQRKWREVAAVDSVTGEVSLDSETGVVLSAVLEGELRFTREGRKLAMKLSVTHDISSVGKVAKVTAPADQETVATYERSKEFDERESLLRGIAPPSRRAPTPQNPTGEDSTAVPQ